MLTTLRNNPLHAYLLANYLALLLWSIWRRDPQQCLYWAGAGLIMVSVLMGMAR
jgi:hypothetical protein